jgi:uncharacterized protein
MSTFAVISDTHLPRGRRTLPNRCLELCASADLLLHSGDVCTPGVWEWLGSLGPPAVGVLGNMDSALLEAELPVERVVEREGARIGMVHDAGAKAGRSERLRERFPGCDAIVYGHTHVPELARDDGVWILNPGSPTERRSAPRHSMLLLELEAGEIRPRLVDL